jgi:CheY-like chemotaxis protein
MAGIKVIMTVTRGPQEGLSVEVSRDAAYIGREKEMDIVLRDPAVSGRHARILITKMGVEIEDLGSRNGTFVNSVPVQSSILRNADKIVVGQTEIQVRMQETGEAKQVSPPSPKPAQERKIEETVSEKALQVPCLSRVLVAGFRDNLRRMLLEQMRENNLVHELLEASNGGDALEIFVGALKDGDLPELVIASLKMPILNGINMAISFRAYEHGFQRRFKIPIIFLCPATEADESFKKAISFLAPASHVPAGYEPSEFGQRLKELFAQIRERATKGVPLV